MVKARLVTPDKLVTIDDILPGEHATGTVATRAGVDGAFPLHAGFRELGAGAAIEWREVASGLIVHLWEGSARIGDIALAPGSVVVIEHGASARIAAEVDGCVLLVFDAAADTPPADAAGGHVHVLPAGQVQRAGEEQTQRGVGLAIFADSTCPTCRLWLHETTYPAGYALGLHSHSQDEIIVVTAGEMIVGNRHCGRGSMLAIAAGVQYSFTVGEAGMQFINFRPSYPTFTSADGTTVIDEGKLYRGIFKAPPPYLELA